MNLALKILVAALLVLPLGSPDAAAQKRSDRATAQRLAELMPEPLEEWNAGKPRIGWLNGGASVRARYWSKKPGEGNYTISLEVRTRGIDYKKELLKDQARAARRGYKFTKIAETPVLVKTSLKRIELRFWYKDRILVFAKGTVPLEKLEEHLKKIDYDKLGAIK